MPVQAVKIVAEVACSVGIFTCSKLLVATAVGDVDAVHQRPTAASWSEEVLIKDIQHKAKCGQFEIGSSIAALGLYSVLARSAKLADLSTMASKIQRPPLQVAGLVGLLCLNYGTAKLAHNVQLLKENLSVTSIARHPVQHAISKIFGNEQQGVKRSEEPEPFKIASELFLQPVVEGVMLHKYLFLRLLPLVGPMGAATGTAFGYALIHRERQADWTIKTVALDALDSFALQAVFILTGGSAVLPIILHIVGNVLGSAVAASSKIHYSRIEESLIWRHLLNHLHMRGLRWYSCIVERHSKEVIALNLMPSGPRMTAEKPVAVASVVVDCFKQPGASKLSVDDAADFIYAFRTAAHDLHLKKFEKQNRLAFSAMEISMTRNHPLVSVLCSDQAYLEAYRRYPNGMTKYDITSFLGSEMLIGADVLRQKKWYNFITTEELKKILAPRGNVCRWASSLACYNEEDEDDAIYIVDDYYKSLRRDLLDTSAQYLQGVQSTALDLRACEMSDVESLLDGPSRGPADGVDCSKQSDEQYFSDSMKIFARRAALGHLQKRGYTIRRWRILMEELGHRYPHTIGTLRNDWLTYFKSPEFKNELINQTRSNDV